MSARKRKLPVPAGRLKAQGELLALESQRALAARWRPFTVCEKAAWAQHRSFCLGSDFAATNLGDSAIAIPNMCQPSASLPPLVIGEDQLNQGLDILEDAIDSVIGNK
ncbi:hypothetical protein [Mesorhizobium sp. M0909]|uniref:hypothetical protein n=1 Tax=Mesorhizobium sp. M0909 TaxID=2957024 RepID=UPI003335067A